MKQYIECLRIPHYIKNLICFFPLFFNGSLFQIGLFINCTIGFFVLCLISSAVYIFNDIHDKDRDKLHRSKNKRPVAAGTVSIRHAYMLAGLLVMISATVCLVSGLSGKAAICLGIYTLINVFYTIYGKHRPILDILCLSSGYPLRLLYGGFLCGIKVSSWLFLTVLCLSLFMGIGKRRGEFIEENAGNTRPVLEQYSLTWINGQMYFMLGLGIVFYSLWAIEKSSQLVYSIPIVLVITMYYNLLILKDDEGDPVSTVLGNKLLVLIIVLYIMCMFVSLYLL